MSAAQADLERFVAAEDAGDPDAHVLGERRRARDERHWTRFVFSPLAGLDQRAAPLRRPGPGGDGP